MTIDDMILRQSGAPGASVRTTLYREHERTSSFSVGTYIVGVGADYDDQVPHREDEVYVVVGGHGQFESDGERRSIGPGSVIFVGRGSDHHFIDVTDQLEVIVVFAPPYSGH